MNHYLQRQICNVLVIITFTVLNSFQIV